MHRSEFAAIAALGSQSVSPHHQHQLYLLHSTNYNGTIDYCELLLQCIEVVLRLDTL